MNTQTRNSTTLPKQIPAGSRIVVRTYKIIENNNDGTQKIEYHDAIGHVLEWDGVMLHLLRDPAANGTRAAEEMFIDANTIYRLKPIPERKFQKPLSVQNCLMRSKFYTFLKDASERNSSCEDSLVLNP